MYYGLESSGSKLPSSTALDHERCRLSTTDTRPRPRRPASGAAVTSRPARARTRLWRSYSPCLGLGALRNPSSVLVLPHHLVHQDQRYTENGGTGR